MNCPDCEGELETSETGEYLVCYDYCLTAWRYNYALWRLVKINK